MSLYPDSFSAATVEAVQAELEAFLGGFPPLTVIRFPSDLREPYQYIGSSRNTAIIRVGTIEDNIPLCVKLGLTHFEMAGGDVLMSYDGSRPGTNRSLAYLDTNRKALLALNRKTEALKVEVLPQAVVEVKRGRDTLKALLVPDLTHQNRRAVHEYAEWNRICAQDQGDNAVLVRSAYARLQHEFEKLEIDAYTHKGSLDELLGHMLFVVTAPDLSGKRFLVAGDLDHFAIHYGMCGHCGQEGPVYKNPR